MTRTSTGIRGIGGAVAAVLVLSGLAACTNPANEVPQGGSAPAAPGFPVSVPGKLGTANVPDKPARVVAMDWTSADIALSLGVQPVGMAKVPTAEGGIESWTKPLLGDAKPALFDTSGGDPVDQVAALNPDLILATKDYNLPRSYQQLSGIAPVVSYADAPNSDDWQTSTRSIASALGKSAEADRVIEKVKHDIAAAAAAHPELSNKTYSFLVTPQSNGVHAVNSAQDASARFLSQLGLRGSAAVEQMPPSSIPGRTMVSWENVDKLNADVALATGPPSSLKLLRTIPGFQQLPAVQKQHYVQLQPELAQAVAFPSPVSLDWALERFVPMLSEAVQR